MATQTTHYSLTKPDPVTDNADISVVNTDMDAIDTQMYNNAQAAAAAQTTANAATAAGAATDTVIGNRTADPTQAPNSLTGTLTQFLSWITNRIKAITGTANWYDVPPTTLTNASSHMTNTNNPHNVTAAQTGAIPTTTEGVANGVATTDANNHVVQTANNASTAVGLTDYVSGTASRIKATWSGSALQFEVDTTPNVVVQNAAQLNSQPASYYQQALGFTPVNRAGDTMTGNLETANNTSGVITDSLQKTLMVQSDSSHPSLATFIRNGVFAAHFGIDTDNLWKVGGWSMGANAYALWHAGHQGSGSGMDSDTVDGLHASQLSSSSSGTWTPASGSLNVAAGTVINVASVSSGATMWKEVLVGGYSGGPSISSGFMTSSGSAWLVESYYGYANGISGTAVNTALAIYDGSYLTNGYFQINNGYLQFVTTIPGVANSSAQNTIRWRVS